MSKLNGTKTHQNLKDAFAGESQANRRYLYFAKVADVEGYPEVAGLFKDTARWRTRPTEPRTAAGLATPLAEGDYGALAVLVRVLDDVGDVGDPQTKGENRCQPKQSARSRTRLAPVRRTETGGPIS